MKFIKLVAYQGENSSDAPKCLVIDDSDLLKTGRYIEKISRIFDHVSRRFILGYKLLAMGYWDGASFVPMDSSLHRERGKNKDKPFGLKTKKNGQQLIQIDRTYRSPSFIIESVCIVYQPALW